MYGWSGTILRINLSTGAVTREPSNKNDLALFLGARGLGVKIFTDEVDPSVDPLSPENKLIFAPGPFTGTMAPSAGRFHVVAKSPLTNGLAGANSGGVFGAVMKYAGYDALIFEGKAEKPVYVWINDDKVEIRDAAHLWGKWVPDTTDAVRNETDADASVACIGPAGEKLVLFASIQNEMHRAAGRGGVGAVMGSKNLKAIALRGSKGVRVADVKGLQDAVSAARAKLGANPVAQGLNRHGTEILVNILNEIGCLPTRNHHDGHFPTADKVGGESLTKEVLVRKKGCFSCVINCGRVTRVKDPKYAGEGEGPEYEAGWGYGPDCGVDNLSAVTKANHLCNELGMDSISAPATIAAVIDLAESGVLPPADFDGLDLRWGNADLMVELTKRIGLRQGIGDKAALGSYRFAELYGHPEYSMSVKKQEIPAYDSRGIQGIGLQYATCNRGGCHVKGYTVAVEVLGNGMRVDPREINGKPAIVKAFQDLTAAVDASGGCIFGTFGMVADDFAAMLSALTGIHYSPADYVQAGERIWNLERQFNLKAGFTAKDDTLPERLYKSPIQTGPSKGLVSRVPEMLPEYYSLRGWSEEGVPSPEKLHELQLA
jgi:aldehyde:ferredoxin oxidoreductase